MEDPLLVCDLSRAWVHRIDTGLLVLVAEELDVFLAHELKVNADLCVGRAGRDRVVGIVPVLSIHIGVSNRRCLDGFESCVGKSAWWDAVVLDPDIVCSEVEAFAFWDSSECGDS